MGTLEIRARPPIRLAARAEHIFPIRIKNSDYYAYVYAEFGQMWTERRLLAEVVGENNVNLYMATECVRMAALNDKSGPLAFVSMWGSSEWLQQCIFLTVDAQQLDLSKEKVPFYIPLLADAHKSTSSKMLETPGSLVIPLLRIRAPASVVRDHISLDSLLTSRVEERMVEILCPMAVIPSGNKHTSMHPNPRSLHTNAKCVAAPIAMHLQINNQCTQNTHLYAKWYGQYLVMGHMQHVDVWPVPGGRRLRDNEVLSFSLDSMHCLLAGLVRFHCEREAIMRAHHKGRIPISDESTELIFDCIHSPTAMHPDMSLRDLMRENGFAALCRTVYRSLLVTGTARRKVIVKRTLDNHVTMREKSFPVTTPASRHQAKWFLNTLCSALAFVVQTENMRNSENETLRFLQRNGLIRYPQIADENDTLIKDVEFLSKERREEGVPQRNGVDLFSVRSTRGENELLKYYRQKSPFGRFDVLSDDCTVREVLESERTEILWIFEVDFATFMAGFDRAREDMHHKNIIIRNGRVQLLWFHLMAPLDRPANEPMFSTSASKQPWIVNFFASAITDGATTDITHGLHEYFRDYYDPYMHEHIRKLKRVETNQERALLHCLPFGNGVFLPTRPNFLFDVPLRGQRARDFLRVWQIEIIKSNDEIMKRTILEHFKKHKEKNDMDIVRLLQFEADKKLEEAMQKGHVGDGDDCVVYNYSTKELEPLNISAGFLEPDKNTIERLFEMDAMPPCLKNAEVNVVRNPNREFKRLQRREYLGHMLSHTNLIDIEDVIAHVEKIEQTHPLRKAKAEKHKQSLRSMHSWYKKDVEKAIEYETQHYGRAQTASGATSCKLILWRAEKHQDLANFVECPYAGTDADPRRACCNQLLGHSNYAIKSPRDYTRLALHHRYVEMQYEEEEEVDDEMDVI